MKRIISLILSMLLCIALVGCGNSGAAPTAATTAAPAQLPVLSVGYARRDISPWEGVPLQGYSNGSERLCNGVITEALYATCIAFTDNTGKTVLLFHLDLTTVPGKVFAPIREAISQATGIPFEQVLLSATHNHSAPETSNVLAKKYVEQLSQWMVEVAQDAIADSREATIQVAEAYPEKLNWIRYYTCDDGSWGSGTLPNGVKRVAHLRDEVDNQLQMIRLVRGDAKDVFLVNWQGHPHREGDAEALHASSDIVGAMRRILEKEDKDVLFAYFSGASGNLNNHSYLEGVTTTEDHAEHGEKLVEYMTAAQFKPVEAAPIRFIYRTEKLTSVADKTNQFDFPVCAFSIGDVAFVTAPYEMFDTSGQVIKESSAFDTTFVITYANDHYGYLPTQEAFDADFSYEARITKVVKGSAEHMEQVYVGLLKEISELAN